MVCYESTVVIWSMVLLIRIGGTKCENLKFEHPLENITTFIESNEYTCKTNGDAEFTWQICIGQEVVCNELHRIENCQDISVNNSIFLIDSYPKLSTIQLEKLPTYPIVGCIKCVARNESNNHTIAQASLLEIIDDCGTPRKILSKGEYGCHRNDWNPPDDTKEFEANCKVAPVRDVRVEQQLTKDGVFDVTLFWKEPEFKRNVKPYGYDILIHESGRFPSRKCLITMYNAHNKTDGYYHYSLTAMLGRTFNINTYYNGRLTALPVSETVKFDFTSKSTSEFCFPYIKKYGRRSPLCHIVENVTIGKCTPDKSRTITWMRSKDSDHFQYTEIYWGYGYYIENLPKNQTSFTMHNVTFSQSVFLTISKSLPVRLGVRRCRDIKPTTSLPHKEENGSSKKNSTSIIVIIVPILVFTIALFMLFIYCGLKRVRSRLPLVADEETEVTVMLVYPHGCEAVEKIVLYLAEQLDSFRLKVLVDIVQPAKVAQLGLPSVLVQNFNDATYVVTLCTEKETTELSSHGPYTFVMNRLISSDCVYQNGNRYIAVYFSKSPDMVPLYLRQKSYSLPSSLECFLQHLLKVKTSFTPVCGRFVNIQIQPITDMKKVLKDLVEILNMPEHDLCNSETCRKGKKIETVNKDYPTSELLQKEVERNLLTDNCSLRFSSTSSLNDNEEEHELIQKEDDYHAPTLPEHIPKSPEHIPKSPEFYELKCSETVGEGADLLIDDTKI